MSYQQRFMDFYLGIKEPRETDLKELLERFKAGWIEADNEDRVRESMLKRRVWTDPRIGCRDETYGPLVNRSQTAPTAK